MSGRVWMRHPDTGGEVEVSEGAIPIMRQSGWDVLPRKDVAARERKRAAEVAATEKAMQEGRPVEAAGTDDDAAGRPTPKENG